jgi:hypothetical protein
MAKKIITEANYKENGVFVSYPLGAKVENVIITDNQGKVVKTLNRKLEEFDTAYSIENIENEDLQKLSPGEKVSEAVRKLYKIALRFINHLNNNTNGENHIPAGGQTGDILAWDAEGKAKWTEISTSQSEFEGASSSVAGTRGLVPAPAVGQQTYFLRGDGKWINNTYTKGTGIDITNNVVSLVANITGKQNVGGSSSTTGTEVTIPYFSFDNYGRITGSGTRKHTVTSTFTGGVLTENLYFGSNKYGITTSGDTTLGHIVLQSDSASTVQFINSANEATFGVDTNGRVFLNDNGKIVYESINKENYFRTNVMIDTLKGSGERVVHADQNGKLSAKAIKYAASSSVGGAATSAVAIKSTKTNPTEGTTYNIPFYNNYNNTTENKNLYHNDGFSYRTKEGEASTEEDAHGFGMLYLGNQVASGVAGNKYGVIRLYGDTQYYTQIVGLKPSANRTINFPDASGTFALDNTMTGATSSAAGKKGLVPAPAKGNQEKFLRGDGTWVTPTNTTYSNFVKSGSGAKAGLVPAPSTTAGTTKYLREDGTWQVPPNTTYSTATTSAKGLMSADDKTKLDAIGTYYSESPDGVSFAAQNGSTGTKLASLTLPAGTYVVICAAHFPTPSSSSSDALGTYRRATLDTTSGRINASRGYSAIAAPIYGQTTMLQISNIIVVSSKTTYYLNGQTDGTEPETVTGLIKAVRIA